MLIESPLREKRLQICCGITYERAVNEAVGVGIDPVNPATGSNCQSTTDWELGFQEQARVCRVGTWNGKILLQSTTERERWNRCLVEFVELLR